MVQQPRASDWRASVVIPAHNEASVIGRCLLSLAARPLARDVEIVVVANGCSDDTAAVARRYVDHLPGLFVIERDQAGKTAALNAGDREVGSFPRVFLDADIELEEDALDELIAALERDGALTASPSVRFDTIGASWAVAAFYRIYRRVPYVTRGLIGLGVYGLSAAGRARFDSFPELTNDDLFVQRLFTAEEVVSSPGTFVVRTPRTWSDLVAVRTRIARGNAQLASSDLGSVDSSTTTASTLKAIAALVARRPWLAADALVYLGTTIRARSAARQNDGAVWLRDSSTRT